MVTRTTAEPTIGERLREARQARGLTLRELADRAGTTESHLSKLERGAHAPSWPLIARVLVGLDLNPNPVTLFSTGGTTAGMP